MIELSHLQLRVIGVLIEKQLSTPEYYPLTRNALVAGCNQKSNREPVMQVGESEVGRTLDALRERDLVREVHDPSGRVPRYAHRINAAWELDGAQAAALCELMLRGPQTAGEIRNRSSRLIRFESVEQVEAILRELSERETPLTLLLPRQPGARERRWAHLLAGEPVADSRSAPDPCEPAATHAETTAGSASRIENLEAEVAQLRTELDELRADYRHFKSLLE
jgi:hypothetical protein